MIKAIKRRERLEEEISHLELPTGISIKELKDLKPVNSGESDLLKAMRLIIKTGKGPKDQIPSMGCNIKWAK